MKLRHQQLAVAALVVLCGGVLANLTLRQNGETRRLVPLTEAPPIGKATGALAGSSSKSPKSDKENAAIINEEIGGGSESETITAVQRNLKAVGYQPGAIDGRASMMTRSAIMAFEHDQGLPLSARATRELLQKIVFAGAVPGTTVSRPTTRIVGPEARTIIIKVKRILRELGYDPGSENGIVDQKAARAIRDFETDQDLPVSGRISGRLIARLARLDGRGRIALGE